MEIANRKIEQKLEFTDSALAESTDSARNRRDVAGVIKALEHDDKRRKPALPHERNLNQMQLDFRRSHVQRMRDSSSRRRPD